MIDIWAKLQNWISEKQKLWTSTFKALQFIQCLYVSLSLSLSLSLCALVSGWMQLWRVSSPFLFPENDSVLCLKLWSIILRLGDGVGGWGRVGGWGTMVWQSRNKDLPICPPISGSWGIPLLKSPVTHTYACMYAQTRHKDTHISTS